ncbi:MAG TPA: phosphoglucomutase/phosphomannomutase family protein [Candidatus Polarisedimenticolia bacterium]|nr:phosphoglucomutase/phosphomannomutase family protein [Candidatus Polarisedimenticolia bacterium]
MPLPEIKFGTDGWRGVMADDFTYASVRRVAQGIAEYMRSRSKDPLAVVGYDCRFASEEFARTAADVFGANGVRSLIFDRPSPTQVASWTVIDRKATGAAVITASHNPWLFNGVKYKPETGSSADSTVIGELEKRINALGEIEPPDREKVSELVTVYDPRDAYYQQIGRMVDLPRLRDAGLRVVHECMHGSGYGYVSDLLGGGKTTVTELHADRNPFFGGLNPEPIPPNIDEAIAVMKGGGHDLCILTDGDADRVGIIDETGRFINQLQVFALLVLHLFDVLGMRGPIVKTVNMTAMVEQLAKQFNTEVYEVQVGFKYVAPKMMETNAVIGGEESGGFGVRGHIPERDGILIGMLFADMIVRRGKPLSEILRDLEQRVGPHAYARHDIHLHRETYERDRKRITEQLANHQPKEIAGVKVARVRSDDGFKFYLEDGSWVLFRTSGTEPLVRIYSEAPDAAAVDSRLAAIEDIVGLKREAAARV